MIERIIFIIKYILSIIHWVLWWSLKTVLVILLILISLIMPKKYWDMIVKIYCKILIYFIFIIPSIKGFDINKLPYPTIFIANHVSFFDLFISGAILPGYPRGFELKSHFKTPVYGWFISRFGQIPTELGNLSELRNSLKIAFDILKNKTRNIYIAPEGKRTITGEIGEFKSGPFYLSKKTGIPIVPILYKGLFEKNNKKSFLINHGFFDVIIFEPVYPSDFANEKEMLEHIRNLMIKKYKE